MDISEKQAVWREQKPLFEAEFIHSHLLPFFNFNENTGDYEIKSECVNNTDDEDRKVAYEALNTGWVMWLRAKRDVKTQAVPEWISMEDRYPKAGESVLICINGIRQNIAYFYDYSASDEYSTGHDWFEPVFTGGETEDECVVKTEDVTHWMLLPQEPTND